ncbi:MAG: DUF1330 domain-containing protein [Alphaproteobacteria bacterium]
MSAYFIMMHEVADVERYKSEYIPAAIEFLEKHKGELVATDLAAEAVQGNPPNAVVVLRFPSKEAVHDFLNDPGYQAAKAVRMELSRNANAVIIPGP